MYNIELFYFSSINIDNNDNNYDNDYNNNDDTMLV